MSTYRSPSARGVGQPTNIGAGKQTHGTYRAVIVSRQDPQNNDRLLVKVPQVLGSDVTTWATPQNEVNTNNKVGDQVRIQFHGGDVTKPSYHVDPTHPWEHPFNNLSQRFTTGPAVFYGRSMHKSVGVGVDPTEQAGGDQLGNAYIGQDLYTLRDQYTTGNHTVDGLIYSSTDVMSAVSLNNHTHTGVHGETSGPH